MIRLSISNRLTIHVGVIELECHVVAGNLKTPMAKLKCEHYAQATRDYLTCVHVMNGEPISLFREATERSPLKDGEAGFLVCAVCAELEEEGLVANTTLICGNCADRLMADQDFVR